MALVLEVEDLLADVIGTVVGALRPSFELAKLEGDAAFVYLPAATVDGPGFRDVIERCYFTFQRRLRDIETALIREAVDRPAAAGRSADPVPVGRDGDAGTYPGAYAPQD